VQIRGWRLSMSWNRCGQKIRYDTRLVEYHRVYWSWQFIEVQKIKVGNMLVNDLEMSAVSEIGSALIHRVVESFK